MKTYRKKRNFESTGEPRDSQRATGRIYVVQEHHASRLHFDFRLEHNGVLLSWAVPKQPSEDPSVKRLAVHVEDHPVDYADFEGRIPEGNYGAGTVKIWDRGTWTPVGDVDESLRKGKLEFFVYGSRLKGRWVLVRMHGEEKKENWLLIKEKDEDPAESHGGPVKPWDEKEDEPRFQLCLLRRQAPKGEGWFHEVKWDGYRVMAILKNGECRFVTRNGNDLPLEYLADEVSKLAGENLVLDGEVVALDEKGQSDFGALQTKIKSGRSGLKLVVLDLLRKGEADLRPLAFLERRRILENLLAENPQPSLLLSPQIEGEGPEVLKAACEFGLEGVVSKRVDSPYSGGRTSDWIKTKCRQIGEAYIGGFTLYEANDKAVGAFLLGEKKGKTLKYIGRVGTGLSEEDRHRFFETLSAIRIEESPFEGITSAEARGARWVKPVEKIKFEYQEFSNGGRVRQGSYQGSATMTRKEKKPTEKPAEKPSKGSSGIQLSHPERVVDKKSGATKQQVFDYYESVSDLIFPQLENRLLSLIRCPGGIAGECFFQKHLPKGDHTGLIGQQVETSEGPEEFFAVRKPVGILELCQQNAIEFHPWGSTLPKFEEPDLVVFDLDPDEGLEWSIVTDAARIVKGRLEELGLIPFTKVTGGKGIHVVCAIQPEYGWDDVKRMCETIAVQIEKENPTLFVTNMRKERRKGKIFLDFQRNSRGATAVAAYSLRARPGMPIAMPVEWDELDDLKSAAEIHLANVQDWLKTRKKDPWANLAKKAPSLKRILGT